MGQQAIQAERLKALNELYSARASRLSAVEGHVPDVVWWIILFGGVITVGFHLLVRLSRFSHACGNDHDSRRVARAGSGTDRRDGLALSRRGQHVSGAYIKTQKSWGDLRFNTQLGQTGDAPQE